jgi:hypothetical protein
VVVSNTEIFRTYLERFTGGDVDAAGELLADEFTFDGPILQAANKTEFLTGSVAAAAMARGCLIRHQWADGENVCSFYDFEIQTPAGIGAIAMAEWSVIRDGKLVSSRLLFDTAAMAALMPAS